VRQKIPEKNTPHCAAGIPGQLSRDILAQLLDIDPTPHTPTTYRGAIQLFRPLGHMINFTQNLKYSCCHSILGSILHDTHHQDYLTISSHQLTKTCCSDIFTKLVILVLGMLIQGCMDFLQEPLMLCWSATSLLEYIIYYNTLQPHLPVLKYLLICYFMTKKYAKCNFQLSGQGKHVALISWTCVDVSQLFGKQTRDLDHRFLSKPKWQNYFWTTRSTRDQSICISPHSVPVGTKPATNLFQQLLTFMRTSYNLSPSQSLNNAVMISDWFAMLTVYMHAWSQVLVSIMGTNEILSTKHMMTVTSPKRQAPFANQVRTGMAEAQGEKQTRPKLQTSIKWINFFVCRPAMVRPVEIEVGWSRKGKK